VYLIYVHDNNHDFSVESIFNSHCFGEKLCATLEVHDLLSSQLILTIINCVNSSGTKPMNISSFLTPAVNGSTSWISILQALQVHILQFRQWFTFFWIQVSLQGDSAILCIIESTNRNQSTMHKACWKECWRIPSKGRKSEGYIPL